MQKPAPKPMKTLPASVAELQRENVTFELESIDRYLDILKIWEEASGR